MVASTCLYVSRLGRLHTAVRRSHSVSDVSSDLTSQSQRGGRLRSLSDSDRTQSRVSTPDTGLRPDQRERVRPPARRGSAQYRTLTVQEHYMHTQVTYTSYLPLANDVPPSWMGTLLLWQPHRVTVCLSRGPPPRLACLASGLHLPGPSTSSGSQPPAP